MNTAEAIKYENTVLQSAKEWINGNISIIGTEELAIIAEHYGVNLPACTYHFIMSDNPNHVCCTGAHKSLFNVMDKLVKAISAEQT